MRIKTITFRFMDWQMAIIYGLLCSLSAVAAAQADRIILKDGTAIESDRVWQTKDHIHFILKGTRDVEIRYAREIVAKIETAGSLAQPRPANKSTSTTGTDKTVVSEPKHRTASPKTKPDAATRKVSPTPKVSDAMDNGFIQTNRGVSFYDPRRQKRYWASRNSKHDTLDSALQALSKIYARSSQWVASNMGEENNLEAIHTNLIRKRNAENSTAEANGDAALKSGQLFFAKGRPFPYHIGPGKDYKTRSEALNALAHQYHRSAEWIQHRIGGENDLQKIHRLLVQTTKRSPRSASKKDQQPKHHQVSQIPAQGVQFYNPRRDHKYWTGKMSRHNTLQEALQALAEQYGVPTDWIETHMGNTNDLSTIHRNIKKSLQ